MIDWLYRPKTLECEALLANVSNFSASHLNHQVEEAILYFIVVKAGIVSQAMQCASQSVQESSASPKV